jgi:hypothetical protein
VQFDAHFRTIWCHVSAHSLPALPSHARGAAVLRAAVRSRRGGRHRGCRGRTGQARPSRTACVGAPCSGAECAVLALRSGVQRGQCDRAASRHARAVLHQARPCALAGHAAALMRSATARAVCASCREARARGPGRRVPLAPRARRLRGARTAQAAPERATLAGASTPCAVGACRSHEALRGGELTRSLSPCFSPRFHSLNRACIRIRRSTAKRPWTSTWSGATWTKSRRRAPSRRIEERSPNSDSAFLMSFFLSGRGRVLGRLLRRAAVRRLRGCGSRSRARRASAAAAGALQRGGDGARAAPLPGAPRPRLGLR